MSIIDAVRAVAVISTGNVEIHAEQVCGSVKSSGLVALEASV